MTDDLAMLGAASVHDVRTIAVACLIAIVAAVVPGRVAFAASFHQYSVAYESSANSGMYSSHVNEPVSHQEATGCSAPYSGNPVYETNWLLFNASATTWDEIGVAHQCNDTYRYYYWGYGYNGTWYSLGTTPATNGASDTYEITRTFTGTYYYDFWFLDGHQKAQVYSPTIGYNDSAGLESYSSPAVVAGYGTVTLEYQRNGGAWTNWSGEDSYGLGGSMCGYWISATGWEAGENVIRC